MCCHNYGGSCRMISNIQTLMASKVLMSTTEVKETCKLRYSAVYTLSSTQGIGLICIAYENRSVNYYKCDLFAKDSYIFLAYNKIMKFRFKEACLASVPAPQY